MDDREQCGAAVLREELRALHQRGRDLNADLKLANSELVGKAEQKTQVETEVGQITRMLVDELGMALETALAFSEDGREPEDWAVKERRIKDRLARMGPVNQIAADEFAKLQERQTFLSGQIDDLIKSQKALKKVIKAIDDKITDRFKQTFEEVNNNFNLMFQELFPGGSAGLVLIEDEEDEEAGVEIEAQPEGKRLKSLSLLSGGERSLVGLALMFALHCSRPSPFYILDEVEAALDMINLQRFIRLMNKLKTKTQFLVITHQRPTMDIADSVYGVSMQADGISKVISQKLEPEEFDDGRRDEVGLVAAAVQRPEEIQDQP
jgi:chromosome segregation protein